MGSELIVEVFALPSRAPVAGLRHLEAQLAVKDDAHRARLLAELLRRCSLAERESVVACCLWLQEDLQQDADQATILRLAITAVCREVENPRSRTVVSAGMQIAGMDLYVAGGTGDSDPEPVVVQVLLLKTLGLLLPLHDPGLEVYRRLHRCTVLAPDGDRELVVHRGHPQYDPDAEDEWDVDTLIDVDLLLQPYYGEGANDSTYVGSIVGLTPELYPETNLPQVAIRVEGGVASVIAADVPVEVLVVDYDVEGTDATQQLDGVPCSIWTEPALPDPTTMQSLRAAAETHIAA